MELPLNRMVYNGSVFINTGKKRAFATHFFLLFLFVFLKLSAQHINKTELIVCVRVFVCASARVLKSCE